MHADFCACDHSTIAFLNPHPKHPAANGSMETVGAILAAPGRLQEASIAPPAVTPAVRMNWRREIRPFPDIGIPFIICRCGLTYLRSFACVCEKAVNCSRQEGIAIPKAVRTFSLERTEYSGRLAAVG